MDGLKNPIFQTLNRAAAKRAADAIQQLGKALPCHVVSVAGQIVTVSFDLINVTWTLPNVTLPAMSWPWALAPIQVGDRGLTVPADAYMGGVSGIGGGTADLTLPGNLSALVFVPVGNAGWAPATVENAWDIFGPQGVVLRDQASHCVIMIRPTGITINAGSNSVNVTGSVINLN